MTRPFRWNEAMIAIGGAVVLLLLGLISPADAFLTLVRDLNTFLFFLGMMALSALAEAAGLFDWLAVQAARFAGKSAPRLFLNVFLLGSVISMILSNDATIFGCDLGPNLTTVGSLATVLWLLILRQRNVDVSFAESHF
jgi:arsenical pump membrane protein